MKTILKIWFFLYLLFGLISTTYAEVNVEEKTHPESIRPVVRASEWWGPRHEEKVKEIQQGDIELLMIGDSITHSWEKSGKEVWEKFYTHRKAANIGFSGDRTEHVLWRLKNGEVDGISPKLAVIMIGTNNTGARRDRAQDTALGIETIIEELRIRLPETKILLLAIFPRSASVNDKLRVMNDEINKIISGFADNEYVYYLNINSAFLDEEGNLSKEIMPDLLHPNANGYRIWANAMEPMIRELMNETN